MDGTNPQIDRSQAAALPPEVEAELRRRLESQAAASNGPATAGPPPLGDFALDTPASSGHRSDHAQPGWADRLKFLGPIGLFLAFLLTKGKFLAILLKFGLPVLKTGGTMLVSIWYYAALWGFWLGLGLALSILVHEIGHVLAAWRLRIPVSAPLFIPGFGALILQKKAAKSAWDQAIIGIGGPLGGTVAGLISLLLYYVTGNELFKAVAYMGFFLNLFNMAPIVPLDGGWITGAVSPRIWLIGVIGMIGLFAAGIVRNPFIILLVLLSLPSLWHGLKTGDVTPEGGVPTTPRQRVIMGLCYVGLCALLVWLMVHSFVPVPGRTSPPVTVQ